MTNTRGKTTTTTTTTTRTTEPGVFSLNDMARLREACIRSIGFWNGSLQDIISRFTEFDVEMILEAIFETGLAPRPSGNYLFAILRRWWDQGIMTRQDLYQDQQRHDPF